MASPGRPYIAAVPEFMIYLSKELIAKIGRSGVF
jgi:hypothetical protein